MAKESKGKTSLPDILNLLREAEEKNSEEQKREHSARKPELDNTKLASDKPASAVKKKPSKRINAETAELIEIYSERKDEVLMSDAQKLRARLAEQNEGEEFLGYISDDRQEKKTSKRVEKLYEMINDAKTSTLSDAEKQPPADLLTDRFSDIAEAPVQQEYEQEQMFPFGDTLSVGKREDARQKSGYDEEYEKLTEKVTSGDIHFDGEEQSEGQVKFVTDEDKLPVLGGEELDETDINLRLAFELMDDKDGSFEEMVKKTEKTAKHEKRKEQPPLIKYDSREQNGEIAAHYRKRIRTSLARIIIVAILTAGILFLELATKDSGFHSEFTRQGRYGILYILIDLQLLFFIALAMLGSIRNGIKGITSFRLTTDSLLVVSIFFAAAYSAVLLFTDPQATDLRMYNLPAAFAALCSAVVGYLTAKKDYRCFRIVASKRVKYAACELGAGAKEADEFYKYLFDDSELYTVKRTDFIEGFVERTEKRPKFEDIFNFLIPVIFVAGVALFAAMKILGNELVDCYAAFSILIAASVPSTAFFMITLPVIAANRIGAKHGTAFIGNAIAEEYSSASVLSFADTEVYPASLVKITNIRMYGDYRIDAVITDLARLFGHIGGPLSKVLAATLSDNTVPPASVRIIESAADGLCLAMEGANYFLGKKSYMRRYRFEAPTDDGDDAYERGVGSIMYVVINEKLAAKLYIKYTVNPLFDSLLKDMYKAGLCLGVKTLDPNINNELIGSAIRFRKCPISVLRGNTPDDVAGETAKADSGVVCASTLHNFLRMFSLCDKSKHVTKSNAIISVVSVFLSFFAVAFLAVTGDVGAITSLHAVAFQLFWLVPVWMISFLMM